MASNPDQLLDSLNEVKESAPSDSSKRFKGKGFKKRFNASNKSNKRSIAQIDEPRHDEPKIIENIEPEEKLSFGNGNMRREDPKKSKFKKAPGPQHKRVHEKLSRFRVEEKKNQAENELDSQMYHSIKDTNTAKGLESAEDAPVVVHFSEKEVSTVALPDISHVSSRLKISSAQLGHNSFYLADDDREKDDNEMLFLEDEPLSISNSKVQLNLTVDKDIYDTELPIEVDSDSSKDEFKMLDTINSSEKYGLDKLITMLENSLELLNDEEKQLNLKLVKLEESSNNIQATIRSNLQLLD